jgi:plasmid stability protein
MKQFTLRSIPQNVDQMLRATARKRGTSINKAAIELLKESLCVPEGASKKRSVRHLMGTWSAADVHAFEKNTRIFDKIDRDMWEA